MRQHLITVAARVQRLLRDEARVVLVPEALPEAVAITKIRAGLERAGERVRRRAAVRPTGSRRAPDTPTPGTPARPLRPAFVVRGPCEAALGHAMGRERGCWHEQQHAVIVIRPRQLRIRSLILLVSYCTLARLHVEIIALLRPTARKRSCCHSTAAHRAASFDRSSTRSFDERGGA